MEDAAAIISQAVEGVKSKISLDYMRKCQREGLFPYALWDACAEQGLLALGVPEALGGLGGGLREQCLLLETLNREGIGLQAIVILAMDRSTLLKHGTEDQIQRFVVPTLDGSMKLCFAITEPNAGTNAFKMTTLATRQDDGSYRLNGQKTWISNFKESDYCLIVARTTPFKDVADRREGISMFMLDTKAAGITAQPLQLGTNQASQQYTLFFDDVVIPAENLIGEEGKGLKCLFHALNPERLSVASMSIGLGELVLRKGVEYAKIRAPFDAPIGSYQGVQHPLAYAKAHLEAARLMRDKGVDLYDAGRNCAPEANMAKLLASDAGFEAVNAAMQAFGGSSMAWENDLIAYFTPLRLNQIAPINNQMMLNYIGEHVLGLPKSY
ncbi:MAG: acyl-CoA dehydrogenase [Sphingomonadales bacterium]|nr:MAG: acyl-CoA dehydrogenase [Sphingomonadales bacterium]